MYSNTSSEQALGEKLIAQIGVYSSNINQKKVDHLFVANRVKTSEGIQNLYDGINKYQQNYTQYALHYAKKHGIKGCEEDIKRGQFFRAQFVRFMVEKNAEAGGVNKGPIEMKKFLGKEKMKLYKLALAEEMNSKEYMNAVFRASTTHFEGEKWEERPFVIVAGPSGCGKTYAAKEAVKKAELFLKKILGDNTGNDVVAIDGGILREVSQIRKLIIQVAMNNGYSIIDDLHDESKILEDAKTRLLNAVFVTPSLGVVLPETFSDILIPFNKKIALLNKISTLAGTVPIFCRVEGEKKDEFQETVALMGSKRALKTTGFDIIITLDLNDANIPEFKIYQSQYFKAGVNGSKIAEEWFKVNNKGCMIITITNDLIIKKEDPVNSGNWVTPKGDKNESILVSRRVFEEWEKSPKTQTLRAFNQSHPVSPLIHTSVEVAIAIAVETVKERVNEAKKSDSANERFQLVCERLDAITRILKYIDTKNVAQIDNIKKQLNSQLQLMDNEGDTKYLRKSTMTALENISNLINQLSRDLHSKNP